MIRQALIAAVGESATDFRWRGGEITRLEGFSDAVFAFAVTLLVVALEVPRTFSDLLDVLRGLPAFALCFAQLVVVWHAHALFFRRYGLSDGLVVAVNTVLLFVVLFYVYPLKFLFTLLIGLWFGLLPRHGESVGPIITGAQMPMLMAVYAAGFVAVFGLFTLLYALAWQRRDALGLDAPERHDTLASLAANGAHVAIGLLSLAFALTGRPGLSGMTYILIGPTQAAVGYGFGRRRPTRPSADAS